jgi:hypothetical protein
MGRRVSLSQCRTGERPGERCPQPLPLPSSASRVCGSVDFEFGGLSIAPRRGSASLPKGAHTGRDMSCRASMITARRMASTRLLAKTREPSSGF